MDAKVRRLVDSMADAASNDGELNALIDDLKDQYPKSFLSVHIVEK